MTAATDAPDDAMPPVVAAARRVLSRYEVVVATIGAIVLLARLAGGGFIADRVGPEANAPVVSPFVSTSAVAGPHQPVDAGAAPPAPAATVPFTSGASSIGAAAGRAPASGATIASPELGTPSPFAAVAAPGAPAAVGVAKDGAVWVATDPASGSGSLLRFDGNGSLRATYALPNISGGVTALVAPASAAGSLFLAVRAPASVVRFDPVTGQAAPYATIPDVRPCLPPVVSDGCDGSVLDAKPVPSGLAFDGAGALYIADAGQGVIWRVPAGGGDAKEFSVTRDWVSPARPSGPSGLAFDGAGNLVVVVRGMLTADTGGVFLIARGADGKAGDVKQLVATPDGARPTGVALGTSGRVYVSFAGTGQIVVFGPDGTEAGRSPRTGEPGLSTPLGLAFLGNDILVAVQAPGAPDDGKIMRVPAGEPGGTVASRP